MSTLPIFPIFLPQAGCKQSCIFCNPMILSGGATRLSPTNMHDRIPEILHDYIRRFPGRLPVEIAFYGGSFTGLEIDDQVSLLQLLEPFRKRKFVQSIRISTRPDECSLVTLKRIHDLGVTTIELGIESFSDRILMESNRGYTCKMVQDTVSRIRRFPFQVGFQIMIGLPGEQESDLHFTIQATIELKPDFVRVHPTLVLKDTMLEELYRSNHYQPLSLNQAISKTLQFCLAMELRGIPVSRVGLHPNPELRNPGNVVAGPYHPAFRQLVDSEICYRMMTSLIKKCENRQLTRVEFRVPHRELSNYLGQKRANLQRLQTEFHGISFFISPHENIPGGTVVLAGNTQLLVLSRSELISHMPEMKFLK